MKEFPDVRISPTKSRVVLTKILFPDKKVVDSVGLWGGVSGPLQQGRNGLLVVFFMEMKWVFWEL